jgi:hypothetical protein
MDAGCRGREGRAVICEECGREASGEARGWRGYLTEYLAFGHDGDLAFYCPECAYREFGPRLFRTTFDDELQG